MESPLRLFLKAKVAGIAIPLVIALAGYLLMYYHFLMAEICFFIAGVWALLMWRASEYLQGGANEVTRLKKKSEKPNAKPKTVADYIRARRQYYTNCPCRTALYTRQMSPFLRLAAQPGMITRCLYFWEMELR